MQNPSPSPWIRYWARQFDFLLFAFAWAYARLRNRGITYWDQVGAFVVSHAPISKIKGTLFILLLVAGAAVQGLFFYINLE